MIPIIRIVGQSGSGKTTIIENLVAELKNRNYRVATIKHSSQGFDIDREGKDSWRHAQAGSDSVLISSSDTIALIRKTDHDLSPAELLRFIGQDFDIVLTEGFKQDKGPKIEVHRKEISPDLICEPTEVMAIATDEPLATETPQFNLGNAAGLVDLIEKELLATESQDHIALFINGEPVRLNIFVRAIFSNILLGMVSSLKRVPIPNTIDVSLRRKTEA